MKKIFLKPGRERSLELRHCWLFSGAIARAEAGVEPGETVQVCSADGAVRALGAYSPDSQIAVRVWSFRAEETIDAEFFRRRVRAALALRRTLKLMDVKGACRLLNSEGDFLPGIVADRYADWIVMQVSSSGAERYKKCVAEILLEETGCSGVYERSDLSVREKEGLGESTGLLAGSAPASEIVIEENGLRFSVNPIEGHKTGFYLDQRENRALAARFAEGRTVLNCFSYTGGFGVAAAANGAKFVTNVDSSAPALARCTENMELNRIVPEKYENVNADVFSLLRKYRAEQRKFDFIVLDPPKLVESQKALTRGCRAYKDMALVSFGLLNPGGLLLNFSCSGLVGTELFQKLTFEAAHDAGVDARVIARPIQAADHPVSLTVPEGFYLKGLLTAVD